MAEIMIKRIIIKEKFMERDQTDATDALGGLFSDILTSHLNSGITVDRCTASLEEMMALAESLVARVHREQDRGTVACNVGCSYCCHVQVKVTPLEALVIFAWLTHAFSPQQHILLKERIANNRHLTEGVDLVHRVMVKALTPCIFLEEGNCSIYPVRPLICRAWTSYDRNKCKDAFESGDHTAEIESSVPSNFVYSLARQTIEKICRHYGLESIPLELPLAMARCFGHTDLFNKWAQGGILFAADSLVALGPEKAKLTFMEIHTPDFFRRFSLSYTKDGTCIEYFLYSKEKKHDISTALIVSHDVYAKAINVSKFYPEIYREALPKYMSAVCFFIMMHHAAAMFDIHCDCSIYLETRRQVFDSFYERLKDFDFVIHHHRISENCNVKGCYHDFPVKTDMITLAA